MSAQKKTTTRPAKNTTTTEPAATAPVLRTDSEKTLWTALGNHPGSTATELAGAAGISGSTARRILSGWATSGAAHRDRDPGNPRSAEHWTPVTEPATSADSVTEPEPAQPEVDVEPGSDTASTATESDGTAPDDTAPATGAPVPPEPATATHAGPETVAPGVDTPDGGPDAAATQQESPAPLAAGALRGLVEDHLRDAPGQEFTPHQIGKALGRSSGAVHNALVKLTTLGTAHRTNDHPKKFALAPGQ